MNSEEQRESHAQSKEHMKCTRKFIQAVNGTKEVVTTVRFLGLISGFSFDFWCLLTDLTYFEIC